MTTPPRSLFLSKCKEAHELIQAFLSDKLSLTYLKKLLPPYEVTAQRNREVKEKVRKSLEVLSMSLEGQKYVKDRRLLMYGPRTIFSILLFLFFSHLLTF